MQDVTRRAAITAFVGVLLLAGCAADPGAQPPGDLSGASSQVREALADGEVTFDEYAASYGAYSGCMAGEGFSLVEHAPDRNGVFNFSVPADAVTSGAEAKCYEPLFGPVDIAYQVANENESAFADRLRACMASNDLRSGDTVDEMVEELKARGIDPFECGE